MTRNERIKLDEWLGRRAPYWVINSVSRAITDARVEGVVDGRRDGILQAAAVASDYDKLSAHPYLVSDCILGKLNIQKRHPRKNKVAN